jgi:hypothetical protein
MTMTEGEGGRRGSGRDRTYTIGEDAGKGRGDAADEIKHRVPFANLIYLVSNSHGQ